MSNLRLPLITVVLVSALSVTAFSQSLRVLHEFAASGAQGIAPVGVGVILGGRYYGVTRSGGDHAYGVLYSVDLAGRSFTVHHHFRSTEGRPLNRVALVLDGTSIYFTLQSEGGSSSGSLYRYDTTGTLTVLRDFSYEEGYEPTVWFASGSHLFGTFHYGGFNSSNSNMAGGVFRLRKNGSNLEMLHRFTGGTDGANPTKLADGGNVMVGLTGYGGIANTGTLFRLGKDGTAYRQLKAFTPAELGGNTWLGDADIAVAGNSIYGLARYGGATTTLVPDPAGFVFRLALEGTGQDYTQLRGFDYNTLYNPCIFSASEDMIVGVTEYGNNSSGGIFRMDADGKNYRVLQRFPPANNGTINPSGLLRSGNLLVGTTELGGTGSGTVYTFDLASIPAPGPAPSGEFSRLVVRAKVSYTDESSNNGRQRIGSHRVSNRDILRLHFGELRSGYSLVMDAQNNILAYKPGAPLDLVAPFDLQTHGEIDASNKESGPRGSGITGLRKRHLQGQILGWNLSAKTDIVFQGASVPASNEESPLPYPRRMKAMFFGTNNADREFIEGTLTTAYPHRLP